LQDLGMKARALLRQTLSTAILLCSLMLVRAQGTVQSVGSLRSGQFSAAQAGGRYSGASSGSGGIDDRSSGGTYGGGGSGGIFGSASRQNGGGSGSGGFVTTLGELSRSPSFQI
jgi:hypothetical protein